jgi:site-specific DNA-methyltransferase (adenine-specific)
MAMCELAWTSMNTPAKIYKQRIVSADKDGRIHPTQKPVQLYKWLLKNYAKPEFKIIDTHLGSGSSTIAAYDFGIAEFVGCEIDKEYFDASVRRFQIHTMQKTLF